MTESLDISMQEAYKEFCSRYPLKKLSMPKNDSVWIYYDINVKHENVIIFIHGICGTAGCFFYQMDFLAQLKYRIISLQYPGYSYISDWIKNLCNILEYLNIKKAHFFASDLGGYLIQLYAKLYPSKISSLILCNSYRRTEDFASVASFRNIYGKVYSFLPHIILKNIMLEDYIYVNNYFNIDLKEKNALEFMSNELDVISASDLGGRISLQLSSEIVESIYVNDNVITLIQTSNNMLTEKMNEDMRKAYPKAKHALMKSGGYFPFLSRHEEVNLYISVHLRNNCSTQFAKEQIHTMSEMNKQGKAKIPHNESITVNVTNVKYGHSIENISSENRNGENRCDNKVYYDSRDEYGYRNKNENINYTEKGSMSNNYNNSDYQGIYRNNSNGVYNENSYRQNQNVQKESVSYYENEANTNYSNHTYDNGNYGNKEYAPNRYAPNRYAPNEYVADAFSEENSNASSLNSIHDNVIHRVLNNENKEKQNGKFKKVIQEEDYDEDSDEEYINIIRANAQRHNANKLNSNFNNDRSNGNHNNNNNNNSNNNTSFQHHGKERGNNKPNDMYYQY